MKTKRENGERDEEEDCRRKRIIMTRLKESLISQLNLTLSTDFSVIENCLQEVFGRFQFHTPTHPPYALMIQTAIKGLLNEESGPTKDAISEFIKREYADLPWAHETVLGLHLRRLCEVGELACGEGGRYSVYTTEEEPEEQSTRYHKNPNLQHVGLETADESLREPTKDGMLGSSLGPTRSTVLKVYSRKKKFMTGASNE